MDPEVSLLLHCAPRKGLQQGQIQAKLSDRYNRLRLPELESYIENVWSERVSREPWLFNGAKFRLHSATLITGSGEEVSKVHKAAAHTPDSHESPHLSLQLGLTCYKDFLGTNWSCDAEKLRRRGEAEFGDPVALLAQPLGVGGVLRTADNQIVFLRRSQKVAEAAGLLDIPGGHPEPKAVCTGVSEESIQVEQLSEADVVQELFSSVRAEIRDEVNVPLGSLGIPVLMGIALNHTSAGRPSAEFYVGCSLTSRQVKDVYTQGGPEANESTDIVFLSREAVLQLDESAPLWAELCPSAKGAVMLYRLVLPDEN